MNLPGEFEIKESVELEQNLSTLESSPLLGETSYTVRTSHEHGSVFGHVSRPTDKTLMSRYDGVSIVQVAIIDGEYDPPTG